MVLLVRQLSYWYALRTYNSRYTLPIGIALTVATQLGPVGP